ncbi:MAG: YkgJ family cysteine cluster protein [Candidatus Thorarchaeota archaeon]|jgi:Fe-S-cluster containining protein
MGEDNSKGAPIASNCANSNDICFECGGQCCKFGGIVATLNEVDAIIERGHPNYFEKLKDDVYGTKWGRDGICAYFENGACSIYSVRPMGCRMFPVIQTRSGEIILIECPLASHLSDEEVFRRKEILIQRPRYIVRESELHREGHIKDLQIRVSKWNHLLL